MNLPEVALCIGGSLDGQWKTVGDKTVIYAPSPSEMPNLKGAPPGNTAAIETYTLHSFRLRVRDPSPKQRLWLLNGLDLHDAMEALMAVYATNPYYG